MIQRKVRWAGAAAMMSTTEVVERMAGGATGFRMSRLETAELAESLARQALAVAHV